MQSLNQNGQEQKKRCLSEILLILLIPPQIYYDLPYRQYVLSLRESKVDLFFFIIVNEKTL